jgi:hypothetical protein
VQTFSAGTNAQDDSVQVTHRIRAGAARILGPLTALQEVQCGSNDGAIVTAPLIKFGVTSLGDWDTGIRRDSIRTVGATACWASKNTTTKSASYH